MQLLLDTSSITISLDHVENWFHAEWKGLQDLQSVQWGALEMLRFLKQEHCRKVFNDNRLVTSIWADAAEWGGRTWFPQMTAAGLQYFAWVYSPNVYSRLSTDLTLEQTTGDGPIVATFENIETARNWLRNV
ncbi:MAG: hypothetical protein H7330_07735 [Hymenobacteraceae bacterium]|nr:hypothetical protein [Hymenobacteraceae bacterium]